MPVALSHPRRNRPPSVILAFGLVSAFAWFSACDQSTTEPQLVLEVVATVPLPDGFPPAGAHIARDGRVLIWSSASPDVLLADLKGRVHVLNYGSNEPATGASFVEKGKQVEVFVGGTGRVATVLPDGSLLTERFLGGWIDSGAVHAGVRTPNGWMFAVVDSTGRTVVVEEGAQRQRVVLALRPDGVFQTPPDTLLRHFVHLTATLDGVVVSAWWPPFRSILLPRQGAGKAREMEFGPEGVSTYTLGSPDSAAGVTALVAMPVLPLDDGFVQTISDLRSDERDLVLFDMSGRELRRKHLSVPLALVASAPQARLLVGFRSLGGMELVVYRWRRA